MDWKATGLPDFRDWDPSLSAVAELMALLPTPMAMMIGPNGILLANDSAQALFPEAARPVNGRCVFEVLPHDEPFLSSMLDSGMAGNTQSFREQPIRVAGDDGYRTRWFNLDFTPIESANGNPLAVLGIACDVTHLVRQIRSLSESEQRLRDALEGAGIVGIWALDIESGIATADANVARAYSLPPDLCKDGIDNQRFVAAIHPEDRERATTSFSLSIQSVTPYRCRYRVLNDSGQTRWVITSAKPVIDDTGRPIHLMGVVVDVTDQMEAAAALAESRFQFQTLTETLPQIVWSCDAEGRHDYFSARWSEFTGIDPEDITEETWKELVFPEHAKMVEDVWNKAMRTGQTYDIDYRFRHHSGEHRWLRVMALPIRGQNGEITRWFGTSTDMHEAYLVSEERERLARELERIANEDVLTGLLTRRAFFDNASAIISRNGRSRRHDSLLMLDIDHFKAINDAYGHPGGDRILAVAASRIRSAVREEDLVGRLGGEEFAVYLPRCSRREALKVAERIRAAIDAEPIALEKGCSVVATISIGVTTCPASCLALDRALMVADKALYEAKSGGRNRAVYSSSIQGGRHRGAAEVHVR